MSLHFNINLYTYLAPVKFLAPLPGRSFCVDIGNSALDITLDHLFIYFIFIHFMFVLVTWSLLLFV